jgi:DUF4097 and DUF4098 domain-containing protein YvlB
MTRSSVVPGMLLLFVFSSIALGEDIHRDLHFKVGKHAVISVMNQYGRISVKAGPPRQVTVSAVLHSAKVEIDQSQSGNRVDLVSHLLQGADDNTGSVEYVVQVPPTATLTLRSGRGSIHAEKLHGDVAVEGADAKTEIVDCGDGHVHIKTVNGSVTLNNVRNGHVEVSSLGGDVVMNGVDGPYLQVDSNSGKIEYIGDFGDGGVYSFSSHTGNIEALAPAYASIDVEARSTHGPVESDFSLEPKHTSLLARGGSAFSGTLGKAASSVKLFSFSGKIHLKKRQN